MITIVSGTNRRNSVTKKIALHYETLLQSKNIETNMIDLVDLPSDFIETALYENEGKNETFNSFRDQMVDGQKFLFVVPEYNGSFPGILKTFLDGLKFPGTLKGKKCAMIGISSGMQGGVIAMSHLTDIFNYLGMNVLALKPKLTRVDSLMENDRLVDASSIRRINDQADALISF
jgi:chromate reductase, NAD(P)H dehydrogenase (quinone)